MKQHYSPIDSFFIITSISSIVAGLICLAYPNQISKLVVILLGASLLTYGIVRLFIFFHCKTEGIPLLSIVIMLSGLICFIRPAFILNIIGIFLGLFLTIQGSILIKNTFTLKKNGFHLWWIWLVLSFIVVAIGISGIFNPSNIYGMFAVILGLGFLISGISTFSLFFLKKRY